MKYDPENTEPVAYRPLRPGERINVRKLVLFWAAVLAVLAIGAGITQAFASSGSAPTPTTVTLPSGWRLHPPDPNQDHTLQGFTQPGQWGNPPAH